MNSSIRRMLTRRSSALRSLPVIGLPRGGWGETPWPGNIDAWENDKTMLSPEMVGGRAGAGERALGEEPVLLIPVTPSPCFRGYLIASIRVETFTRLATF